MSRPVKVQATVRLRAYPVISEAVEGAILGGLHRAYKHTEETPSDEELERVREHVALYVMNALCELLDFGDP